MKTARVIAWFIVPIVLIMAGAVLLAEGCARTVGNVMDFIEILVKLDAGKRI